jgi:hypothetical protein
MFLDEPRCMKLDYMNDMLQYHFSVCLSGLFELHERLRAMQDEIKKRHFKYISKRKQSY